jgi:oxaloacetate decarboxylase (Na+ extruding) subunit gamma
VIGQGLVLTVIGMVVVFVFLAILVLVLRLVSGIVKKYFEKDVSSGTPALPAAADEMEEIAAAIAVVAAYQNS